MVKRQHKIMCLVLCLMLAVSTVFVGVVSASAATGDTVYVRVNNGWSKVNCYMWTDGVGSNATWPGKAMTKVEDGVYSYTLDKDYTSVIFNNGSDQTDDLTYPGHGKIYDLTKGTWSDYAGAPSQDATAQRPTSATTATTATTPSGEGTTVYLNNEAGWATPVAYMWNSNSDSNGSWPGVKMTNIGGNVYQYTASKTYASCIFSNSGQSQTGNLTAKDGYIYNNKNTFTEWYNGRESDIPKEYKVMSFPQAERPDPSKVEMDAAAPGQRTAQTAEQPQEPRPVIPIVLTSEKPAEKLKEITDRLEQGIAELFDSERYREYLKVMSKFHNYSFRNTVLIAMQKPDASLVAGFSAWKNNFERNVMKGQKGIKIIAPSPYKIKQEMQKIDPHTQKPVIGKDGKPVTEEKEVTIPAYKVVSVFDVSQTEGKELPDIAVDELTGDVDRYKDFFAALEKTSPVPIAFENIEGGSHGYYHLEDKRIAINEGMSELQTLKTAIHEIAHAKLHDIDLNAPKDEQQPHVDRRTREVEAESVAYTVCQHYGLDTSDYSFGYVAGWSSGRELSELKSSLETIRSAAAEIINSIDENLAELQKAQDKEQTAGQEQPTREGQEAAPEKPEPEAAAPGKSGAQEKAGAAPKEAFTPETIYRVRRNLYSDSRENSYLLQAYVTQENGRAKMGDVLYTGTPEKCRELMGQLKSGELTEGDVKQLYAKAQETAQTAGQDKDTFSIYQIKGGDETRDFRFEPYDRLQAAGNVVDRANYELVYSAPLAPETSLEDIYTCFNIDHPKDFKGHSLSVSDVVVLHQDGQDAAHFVDSVGFREVPEFLQEQKQLTPDDLETGETVKTPRGTFHVTAMSREQIEAAGYGFHHQSDDGKYLIMGNGTRAFAVAAEQAQRDNPLKTAEQTTEQNGNMIDGIINNTPTVDELEAKVKAGEQISLVDLANAVKADKERGKGAKPEKKPSIRAQLRADKEKAQKKNAKQKSQDLERS